MKALCNSNSTQVTIMWTNSSPSSSFASQDIILESNDYDLLVFIFGTYITESNEMSCICRKTKNACVNMASRTNEAAIISYTRIATCKNDTTYTIDDCKTQKSNSTTKGTSNDTLIPRIVYGVKF